MDAVIKLLRIRPEEKWVVLALLFFALCVGVYVAYNGRVVIKTVVEIILIFDEETPRETRKQMVGVTRRYSPLPLNKLGMYSLFGGGAL